MAVLTYTDHAGLERRKEATAFSLRALAKQLALLAYRDGAAHLVATQTDCELWRDLEGDFINGLRFEDEEGLVASGVDSMRGAHEVRAPAFALGKDTVTLFGSEGQEVFYFSHLLGEWRTPTEGRNRSLYRTQEIFVASPPWFVEEHEQVFVHPPVRARLSELAERRAATSLTAT